MPGFGFGFRSPPNTLGKGVPVPPAGYRLLTTTVAGITYVLTETIGGVTYYLTEAM